MALFRFNCPNCAKPLKARDEMLGRVIKCPRCQIAVKVPTAVLADQHRASHVVAETGAATATTARFPAPPPRDSPEQSNAGPGFFDSTVRDAQTQPGTGPIRVIGGAIRQHFGQAIGLVLSHGAEALAVLVRHPLRLSFYTLVFLLLAIGSVLGVVTIVLLPMFLMGYLTVIKQVLNRESVNLAAFIAFMRHGWNSLWQLLMLYASFLVTISIIVAPAVLLGAALYVGGKTLTLAYSAIPSVTADSDLPSQRGIAWQVRPPASSSENKFLKRFFEFVSDFFSQIMLLLWIAFMFWPLCSALILFFFLTLDVSTRAPEHAKAFDLVYDSFNEMLAVARYKWKEVILSGLFVSTALGALAFLIAVAMMLLARGDYFQASVWLATVGVPIAAFGFVVYVILFMATTCLRLKQRPPAATAEPVPLR